MPTPSRSSRPALQGSSVFEFVLVLPAAALVIVAMIGSARTLLLRQYALIAAREAAFYQRVTGCVASPERIARDIPAGDSPWQLGQGSRGSSGVALQVPGGSSIFSVVAGFIGGADGALNIEARNQPRRGYIAQRFRITDAKAEYSLIAGYWTNPSCSVILNALTSLLGVVGRALSVGGAPRPGGGC